MEKKIKKSRKNDDTHTWLKEDSKKWTFRSTDEVERGRVTPDVILDVRSGLR